MKKKMSCAYCFVLFKTQKMQKTKSLLQWCPLSHAAEYAEAYEYEYECE